MIFTWRFSSPENPPKWFLNYPGKKLFMRDKSKKRLTKLRNKIMPLFYLNLTMWIKGFPTHRIKSSLANTVSIWHTLKTFFLDLPIALLVSVTQYRHDSSVPSEPKSAFLKILVASLKDLDKYVDRERDTCHIM